MPAHAHSKKMSHVLTQQEIDAVGLALGKDGLVDEEYCRCLKCEMQVQKRGFVKHAASGEKRLQQYTVS
jgi:hypothetical protein